MCVRRFSSMMLAIWCLVALCGPAAGQSAPAMTPANSHYGAGSAHASRAQADQWFLHGRTLAGTAPSASRYRALRQKLEARAARQIATQHDATSAFAHAAPAAAWSSLGPAPLSSDASGMGAQDYNWVSGRATAVAIDRNDASGNTVYLGGAYGGVWKSATAGPLSSNPAAVVWAPLLDNQATLSVGAIAIQPQASNPDSSKSIILVGTGETNSSAGSYYGLGILRSADAGGSWSLIASDAAGKHPFAGIGFSQIAFSTANPALVVAAAAGTSQGALEGLQNPLTANLGIYFSADAGQNWSAANIMDGTATVSPSSVTSVVYNAVAGEFFAAIRFHGFYASIDGQNWLRLAAQPGSGLNGAACPANPTLPACPLNRGLSAVVPGRNEMYSWYVDANDVDQKIWRSIDGGVSWTPIDDSGIGNCGDVIAGCGTEDASDHLTLAVVPDGATGTDIYAGAVNLFKCEISNTFPSCSPSALPTPPPQATFLNLTHAYGCAPNLGSIAKVHPGQHAIDAVAASDGTQMLMYFANDGGIYRALDGYTGLTSGTCGTVNHFDSLNQTLGSLTQFVSLAEHPTDANTILGGTQGNGSPATASALTNSSWSSVNSADGGYSEINPDNPAEWFTANTGVSIQRCSSGIGCHAQDFNADLVVSNSTVGGDEGALYTPYLLDPQNSGELLVGTCRIWRGTSAGTGFVALSNNFETLANDACTGNEMNVVRSVAAGGLKDSSELSTVIYAGTDGLGPLATPSVKGGHVWVTTNPAGGAAAWLDRAAAINPGGFPVSSVAVDTSDPSGNTAYLTIMGFHVSHVWKTSNAGQSWTDFTANLPDAPANAILVDPGVSPAAGIVYVGTDVGVFSSATGAASWTEVGPPSSSGDAGFLPNVAVTALRLFHDDPTKLLRASTYGRGVWQFPLSTVPDFQIAFPLPSATVFAGHATTIPGILSGLNGYSNPVTLTCLPGSTNPPSTCAPAVSPVIPAPAGTKFTITTGGVVGDYSFLVSGTGPDVKANPLVHSVPIALSVVDFTFSAASPSSLLLQPGQDSGPITLQVGFLGSFPADGTVELSCNPPAGLTCVFFPSASLSVSQTPVAVTLIVSAAVNTQKQSLSLDLTASSSAAGSKILHQPLAVVVGAAAFTVAVSPSNSILPVGQQAVLNGTATSINSYNSPVNFQCTGSGNGVPPPTCSINPSSLTPSAAGSAFQLTMGGSAAGSFTFHVHGAGTDGATADAPVALTVYDFAISASSSAPIKAGQTANFALTFTPEPSGSTFPTAVGNLACSGLPPLSTCQFGSTQIPASSGEIIVPLMISTTAPVALLRGSRPVSRPMLFSSLLWPISLWPVTGIAFFFTGIGIRARNRKLRRPWLVLAFVLAAAALQMGCSGGLTGGTSTQTVPQPGTVSNVYTVTIAAAEGSLTRSTTLTLTVQ